VYARSEWLQRHSSQPALWPAAGPGYHCLRAEYRRYAWQRRRHPLAYAQAIPAGVTASRAARRARIHVSCGTGTDTCRLGGVHSKGKAIRTTIVVALLKCVFSGVVAALRIGFASHSPDPAGASYAAVIDFAVYCRLGADVFTLSPGCWRSSRQASSDTGAGCASW
jgi:hypothetical protein